MAGGEMADRYPVIERPVVERLVGRTVPVPDPGDLIGALPGPAGAAAWVRQGAGLVGWGEAAQVTLPAGDDRFAAGEKWLREVFDGAEVSDEVGCPGTGLVAFGSFTFDERSDGSVLTVPRAVLGRDGTGRAWLTTIRPAREPAGTGMPRSATTGSATAGSGTTDSGAAASADSPGQLGEVAADGAVSFGDIGPVRWHDGSLSGPEWQAVVAAAVARITRGDLRKVVLARDLYATADSEIDPRAVLARLAARYPDCYTFACGGLLGATPELLIRREGDEVRSLVLAGTKPRGATTEEDRALAAELLASAKEVEEHLYAAASVREVLAPLCESLSVSPGPELLTLPNVHHLGTRVAGRLATDRSVLALAAALHPTAAVGGDPTDIAVEVIRELEGMDRARYAGPVGWMDAQGNGEWGIALRCAQVDGNVARLFAGCGIVAGSDPAAELAETLVKFRPMRMALDGGADHRPLPISRHSDLELHIY